MVIIGGLSAAACLVLAAWILSRLIVKYETENGFLQMIQLDVTWCGLTSDASGEVVKAFLDLKACTGKSEWLGRYVSVTGQRVPCDAVRPPASKHSPSGVSCFEANGVTLP
jgi:hypothetical protein